MAETEKIKLSVEKKLMVGLVVSILLSTTLIVLASSSKETVFSPYVRNADGDYQYQQLSKMRDTLGESDDGKSGEKYSIHNTCLLYTSPSPRDRTRSRMPSSA